MSVTVAGNDRDNVMRVSVQRPHPAITDPDLRWGAAGEPIELARRRQTRGTQWVGEVALPAGESELRLLIEDLEPAAEPADGFDVISGVVVYAETIELPSAWLEVSGVSLQ